MGAGEERSTGLTLAGGEVRRQQQRSSLSPHGLGLGYQSNGGHGGGREAQGWRQRVAGGRRAASGTAPSDGGAGVGDAACLGLHRSGAAAAGRGGGGGPQGRWRPAGRLLELQGGRPGWSQVVAT
ncbi:putative glycine-rich cell wall structural protein 1 [Ananas comosus]|uniref:Glycine-rich cell wall structural protein 1 n=1 Tax=Ananas comosus TaxID=4615 RepID=A0A6P5GZN1_ANACO|nr:putative glycine-rich cell wall structural protein 1 [Ananas comosus]